MTTEASGGCMAAAANSIVRRQRQVGGDRKQAAVDRAQSTAVGHD
jgi:hypothetical protein